MVATLARGEALDAKVNAPMVATKLYDNVPMLDVSASFDAETQNGGVFIVNRSETESVTTEIVWEDSKPVTVTEAWQLAGTDPTEVNTWEEPNRLVAQAITLPTVTAGRTSITLPPLSFTVLATRAA
jgi:alpha-N-arabinofuranosidase